MQRIFVSALSTINALGHDVETMWQALLNSQSGIAQVTHFDTSWLPIHQAAEIKNLDQLDLLSASEIATLYPASRVALSCARSTLKQAGLLTDRGLSSDETLPLFMATTQGDVQGQMEQQQLHWNNHDELADQTMIKEMLNNNIIHGLLNKVANGCGLSGLQSINTNACSSSGYAIACGMENIRQGLSDKVLCGGVDVTSPVVYSAFCSLRSLAPEKCQPFDKNREGLVIGEGCGMLLLESEASLSKRKQAPLAELTGYGWSNDAYHLVSPHPDGRGVKQAIGQAIDDAGIRFKDVDGIVAHGTGTPANDVIEAQSFRDLFGDALPPITAPKASLGHTMGAASVIEAIIAIQCLNHQLIPPTINHELIDPTCPIKVVTKQPQSTSLKTMLTNSSGFGGSNNSLIIKPSEKQINP